MKFALIGHPVAGSLSPRLFAAAYGGRHTYELLDFDRFEDAWKAFLEGYDGINVTAPYKLDAFASVNILTEEARRSAAVNLVVKTPEGLLGHNSDVEGVVGAVRESGFRGADVLVVGTGGAARAALTAAEKLGLEASVMGRSADKTKALAQEFGAKVAVPGDAAASLIIYTLPGSAPVPEGLDFAESTVLEAEYRRPALRGVRCLRYIPGERWLLHQAAAGYGLLTGERPDMDKLFNAI